MSPFKYEASLCSNEHSEFLKFVLSIYEKDLHNLAALIGNNENTNRDISRTVAKCFVGCHSHVFSLTVKSFLENFNGIITKVKVIMHKLSYHIPAAKLSSLTYLKLRE